MAHVDPGELKYRIMVDYSEVTTDDNDHYINGVSRSFSCWAGMRSSKGGDRMEDGAERSVDTVQFIVRWATRLRIPRGAIIKHRDVNYHIDWMDATPWGDNGGYARIRAVSYDQGEGGTVIYGTDQFQF